jgi:uncharacterized protein involved in outer membrane biogenesis
VLLTSALLAAWVVPGLLDWTRYRTTIESLASSTIGHPVRIDGPISLSLLPETVLSADRVRVVSTTGESASPAVSIDALRVRVALGPLLRGHLVARELVLRHPTVRIAWPLRPEILAARPPPWVAAFSARVEDGRILLGSTVIPVEEATLSSTDGGGLTGAGTARAMGQPWRVGWRLTSPGPDGAAGLDLTLVGQDRMAAAAASFSGQIAADGSVVGDIIAQGPSLAAFFPAPAVPFRTQGRLTAASGLAAADNLTLSIAGAPAQAAVSFRADPAARLDIALAASRLDLDAWAAALEQDTSGIGLPLGIDISAEAGTLAGGTVRRLRASVDLLGGPAMVRELTALLPGDAKLSVTGQIARDARGAPRFEGDGTLNAPNLRATLTWLESGGLGPAITLPPSVLQSTNLHGKLLAEPHVLALDDLKGEVDGVSVAGTLGLRSAMPRSTGRAATPPALAADLEFGPIVLDPWLPNPDVLSWSLWRGGPASPGFDADLRLHADRAVLHGQPVTAAALEARAQGGTLTVRRLSATRDGATVTIAGTRGADGRISDGRIDVAAADGRAVAAILPRSWRGSDELWQGPVTAQIAADGPRTALAIKAALEVSDARVEAQPTIDVTTASWSGPLTVRHPGGARLIGALGLLRGFGVQGGPGWIGDGSLSLVAQVSGSPGRMSADGFDLTAGSLRASGRLVVEGLAGGSDPSVSGQINAETLPLPMLSLRSTTPLPLAPLSGWGGSVHVGAGTLLLGLAPTLRHVAADVTFGAGGVALERVTAEASGGAIAGAASLTVRKDAPPHLTAQFTVAHALIQGPLADVPFDVVSGTAAGSLELSADGHSPAALLATLTGAAALTVDNGRFAGFDMERLDAALALDPHGVVAAARDAVAEGTTPFDHAEFQFGVSAGIATVRRGSLSGPAGRADLEGTLDLPSGAVDLYATVHPVVAGAPLVGLRVSGRPDAVHRVPDVLELERWIAERS